MLDGPAMRILLPTGHCRPNTQNTTKQRRILSSSPITITLKSRTAVPLKLSKASKLINSINNSLKFP